MQNISPLPVHEAITENGKPTIAFIRYLLDLRQNGLSNNQTIKEIIENLNNIQEELDNTQIGAGLEDGGSYKASSVSNYINEAISLYSADILLDTAIYTHTRELVISTGADLELNAISQTVFVDAVSGDLYITLPSPSNCFDANRSLRIAIHKIDSSENIINIIPNGSELIVGESSQTLEYEGEILNFITDGKNWYLGA